MGKLVGAEGVRQAGIEQNRAGKEMEARGMLSDLGGGAGEFFFFFFGNIFTLVFGFWFFLRERERGGGDFEIVFCSVGFLEWGLGLSGNMSLIAFR